MTIKYKKLSTEQILKSFEDGTLKENARSLIKKNITFEFSKKNLAYPLSGLTLPSAGCKFESMLLNIFPNIQFTCLERDKKIYDLSIKKQTILLERYPKTSFNFYLQDDFKYFESLKEEEKKFDFIWLDYCGAFSKSKLESLKFIFKKKLLNFKNGNPVMGITLMNGMDFYGIKILVEKSSLSNKYRKIGNGMLMNRLSGFPRLVHEIAQENGYSINPHTILYYKDGARNRRATPMLLFCFKIFQGTNIIETNSWNVEFINSITQNIKI
jgi:hypothetical protein